MRSGTGDANRVAMLMPPVSRFMTSNPHAISSSQRLHHARSMMRELGIHHLPVVDDDKLVGIISDRDLSTIVLDDTVADAMTTDVAAVTTNAPLDEVLDLMGAGKISSVVVTGSKGIEGIFTMTDALRAFSEFLGRVNQSDR